MPPGRPPHGQASRSPAAQWPPPAKRPGQPLRNPMRGRSNRPKVLAAPWLTGPRIPLNLFPNAKVGRLPLMNMTALYVFDIDQSRKQGQISKNVSLHFSQPAPIITSLSNHFNNLAKPRPAKIDTDCSSWVRKWRRSAARHPGTRLRIPLPWGPSYHNPPDVKIKSRIKINLIRFFSYFTTLEGTAIADPPPGRAAAGCRGRRG